LDNKSAANWLKEGKIQGVPGRAAEKKSSVESSRVELLAGWLAIGVGVGVAAF